jgi:hypothetical protein
VVELADRLRDASFQVTRRRPTEIMRLRQWRCRLWWSRG